jgi:molybdate transport system substrate-binding protein
MSALRRLAPVLALVLAVPGLPAAAADITVFAAASLKTALDRIAADWSAATGNTVTASYAGTPQLARQIQQGAPADVFISAAQDWMDRLEADGLVAAGTRRDLLGNRLVLVAHDAAAAPVAITPDLNLPELLGDGKLAMAMVDSVPAGQYGKAALTTLGLWSAVEPAVVQSDNVRAALALVALGEAPYGIVYASDAVAEPRVTVIGTFPADSHAAIAYPAALVAGAAKAEAVAFLDHLSSDAATVVFREQGFLPID